jgi:hypothetical protein
LLEQLAALPENLALVAVGAHKAPYLPNWQRSPLNKVQIESEIQAGRCKAVGVLCGTPSGGLVFLDHDGDSCDHLIETLSGLSLNEALPRTVGITSSRPGRYQLIYRLSQQDWRLVTTRKLKTGTTGDDGKAEMLEFRWDGCQSVVLGHHPTTGVYRYLPGQSFAEYDIVIAPQWIVQQMQTEPQTTAPSWTDFERQFRLPIDQAFPLEICLSKNSRELLAGVTQGDRDNAGAKLTRDLLGTARYLESIGQPYEGNPRHHLDEFCARCTPPLSQKDSDRLWKSALKDNPGSSLSPDQIESCIKGWLWRQMRAESHSVSLPVQLISPSASTADPQSLTLDVLQLQIRQFVSGAPTDTQLTAQVMTWASRIGKPEGTVWSLVKSIQQELEHQQSRSETRTEIDRLTRLASYQPALNQYLDPLLAHPLEQIAYWMGTTSMAMLTTLLPTAGSLLPVGTELELNTGTEHMVYPILYTGIVAESGSGKSPSQKIVSSPCFVCKPRLKQFTRLRWKPGKTNAGNSRRRDRPHPINRNPETISPRMLPVRQSCKFRPINPVPVFWAGSMSYPRSSEDKTSTVAVAVPIKNLSCPVGMAAPRRLIGQVANVCSLRALLIPLRVVPNQIPCDH